RRPDGSRRAAALAPPAWWPVPLGWRWRVDRPPAVARGPAPVVDLADGDDCRAQDRAHDGHLAARLAALRSRSRHGARRLVSRRHGDLSRDRRLGGGLQAVARLVIAR